MNAWVNRDVRVLVRVRENINVEVVQGLADGSALVEVVVREEARKVGLLKLREIQARGVSVNGKRFKLRLWTTLLDPVRYPAAKFPPLKTTRIKGLRESEWVTSGHFLIRRLARCK